MKAWQQSSKTDNELIAGPQIVRIEMTPEEAQKLAVTLERRWEMGNDSEEYDALLGLLGKVLND